MSETIQLEGVVEALHPSGFVDDFDDGRVAVHDVAVVGVTGQARPLQVVLDQPPSDVDWQPGLRLSFRISPEDLAADTPIFQGSLLDLRAGGDAA